MKTAEPKTTSGATAQKANRPFFSKKAEGSFFGESKHKESSFFKPSSTYSLNGNGVLQTKLTIGQPNDKYEQEADATADKVVQRLATPDVLTKKETTVQAKPIATTITPLVQAKCASCEEEDKLQKKEEEDLVQEPSLDLQRKPIFESNAEPPDDENTIQRKCAECEMEEQPQKKSGSSDSQSASSSIESSLNSSKGNGSPIPESTRTQMESSFGADFSNVRLHTDSSAVQMNKGLHAQAFTHGSDIYFNSGKYDTGSAGGKHLLAHELTHVVQQGASTPMVQKTGGNNIKDLDNSALEALGHPKEGYIKKEGSKIGFYFDKFPTKQYVSPLYKKVTEDLHEIIRGPYKKPTGERKTRQGYAWRKEVLPKAQVRLKNIIDASGIKGSQLLFKIKENEKKENKKIGVVGSMEQVAREIVVPFWSLDGKSVKHQIEHKIDWQIAGGNPDVNVDQINNLILLDSSANIQAGQTILSNMRRFYTRIYNHYSQVKKVEGLIEKFSDASPEYDIYCNDPLVSEKESIQGSILSASNFEEKAEMSPLAPRLVTIEDIVIPDGKFVLHTSASGAGNIVPYNVENEFVKIVSDEIVDKAKGKTTYQLKSITLKNVVKDEKGNIDQTNPDKNLTFEPMPEDRHYRVKTEGYAAYLKDHIRIKGLSLVDWEEADFSPLTGWNAFGRVKTNIDFINKANIVFEIQNSDFIVRSTLTSEALKGKLPSPFSIDKCSLSIAAGSKLPLTISGDLDFSIKDVGKGTVTAMANTNEFSVTGIFDFDKKTFDKGRIRVAYHKKSDAPEGNWTLDGQAHVGPGKITGVQSLDIDTSYKEGIFYGEGNAKLNIPGIKEAKITVVIDNAGALTIEGDMELGDIPRLKGAKGKVIVSRTAEGWSVGISGKVKPDINIAGLSIEEVSISYYKGVFDVNATAHFSKGKLKGDFQAGVTNANITPDGKKAEGTSKELNFYAAGEIGMEITKGVELKLKIRFKPDGDMLIAGKLGLTEDKYIIDPRKADSESDPKLNIWSFKKSIPVASCGVASVVVGLEGGIGLFYEFEGLKIDRGTNVELAEISVNNLSAATVTTKIRVSSGVKAGVDAYLGASVGLQVLIAGIRGKGKVNLRLTAIEAKARANVDANFSSEKGLQFNQANLEFDVASRIGFNITLGIEVYLDLLLGEITLWEHEWKPESLKGEQKFNWFGGTLTIPLKFGENNSLTIDNIKDGLKEGIESKAKDESTYERGAMKGVNEEGPTEAEKTAEAIETLKKDIKIIYRGEYSDIVFAFNSSLHPAYFEPRKNIWYRIDELNGLDPKLAEIMHEEIRRYEFEEYDKFGEHVMSSDFGPAAIEQLIEDFLAYRPTLGETERINLRSLIPKEKPKGGTAKKASPKKKKPVQRKVEENESVQPKREFDTSSALDSSLENNRFSGKGPGNPLPDKPHLTRGSSLNNDLSDSWIYEDAQSPGMRNDLHAQAFTHGSDIYFNEGEYRPENSEGKYLRAHDLTHTLQQATKPASAIQRVGFGDVRLAEANEQLISEIQATQAYKTLAANTKKLANEIIEEINKKDQSERNHLLIKLKLLFNTPEKSAEVITTETNVSTAKAVKVEKARITKPREAINTNREEKASRDPYRKWVAIKGKFGGGTYYVDNTSPINIIVKAKILLKPTGTGTGQNIMDIKKMEDGIEKAASTKGYLVDIQFVNDASDPDTFQIEVNPSKWETATNWSGGDPVGYAHELHHIFAFELDRYNYIDAHADNESMEVPTRLYWFRQELKKPMGYNDPTSLMNSASHPNDSDVCTVAGLDQSKCMAERKKLVKP